MCFKNQTFKYHYSYSVVLCAFASAGSLDPGGGDQVALRAAEWGAMRDFVELF